MKKPGVWKAASGLAFRQPSFHVIPFGHIDGNTLRASIAPEGSVIASIKAMNRKDAE